MAFKFVPPFSGGETLFKRGFSATKEFFSRSAERGRALTPTTPTVPTVPQVGQFTPQFGGLNIFPTTSFQVQPQVAPGTTQAPATPESLTEPITQEGTLPPGDQFDVSTVTGDTFTDEPATVVTDETPVATPSPTTIPVTDPTTPTGLTEEEAISGKAVVPSGADDFTKILEEVNAQIEGREVKREQRIEQITEVQARRVREVNKQIRQLQAQALEDDLRASRSGETLGFARGERAIVRERFAIEALRLSAISEALQGNLAFAQSQAGRAVDAEFAETERQGRIARNNIIANFDSFTPAEKRQAEAALLRLDEQDAFVAEQKENRKEAGERAVDIISLNPDMSLRVRNQLQQARSEADVLGIAQRAGLATEKAGKKQFVSATKTQSAGVFDPSTGVFTPTAGTGLPGAETVEQVAQKMAVIPTPGSVRSYLASVFSAPDISAGARTQIGNVVNVALALEDFASANPEGEFAGLGAGAGIKRFFSTVGTVGISEAVRVLSSEKTKAERVENRQAIEAVNLKVQIWASGAALTDEQTKQVERLAPKASDTDRQLKRKINGLYNFMMGQAEARLLTEGINNPIPKLDLFEFEDLISRASPEQLAELETGLQ